MTEILTESFCERCGTRYTFESARPRVRLKGVKVLSRGLKNFVLSDGTSIDEAMAAARSETDREATSHHLDAFHKTFNFCMSCRQYTCPNCWNEAEVRCLSCAPLAIPEPTAAIDDLRLLRDAAVIDEPAWTNGTPLLADEPWSTPREPAFEPAPPEKTLAEAPTAAAVDAVVAVDAEAVDPASADAAGKAAAQTTGLLQRFRPGQSLDAELDAFERQRSDAQAAEASVGAPGSLAAETAQSDAAVASEPEPAIAEAVIADRVETDPAAIEVAAPEELEPVAAVEAVEAATPEEPEPVAAFEPPAVEGATGPGADVVEQPTWRITAPDVATARPPTPPTAPATAPVQANGAPTAGAEPQWPARPEWPSAAPTVGLPFLGRPAAPQGGIEALWAASNQEIITTAPAPGRQASGIQPCISCGLSLSATARFCRRCGTLQGR